MSLACSHARAYHTAVWTGSEMIVWGGIQILGFGGNIYGDGGRYNPVTDVWTPMPDEQRGRSARFAHGGMDG